MNKITTRIDKNIYFLNQNNTRWNLEKPITHIVLYQQKHAIL